MAERDYYSIFGVSRNASDKEIRQAYRRLARKHHPDVNPGDKAAGERFKEINRAYEVLSDPEKRRKYDRFGRDWERADAFSQASAQRGGERVATGWRDAFDVGGFDDLFDTILGGRGGFRASQRARRGRDVEYPVEVTLEEAYHGATRLLQMQTPEVCSACQGTGLARGARCSICGGAGSVVRPRRLETKIPPGVKDGSRVRIAGEGEAGAGGGPKGDLYLVVSVRPHDRFERKEDDLTAEVAVSLTVAVLGGEVEVPTLRGKVALRIPPESQNGQVFRLAGQGMPHLGHATKGDLYAIVKVVLPAKLTPKQRELFRQLEQSFGV